MLDGVFGRDKDIDAGNLRRKAERAGDLAGHDGRRHAQHGDDALRKKDVTSRISALASAPARAIASNPWSSGACGRPIELLAIGVQKLRSRPVCPKFGFKNLLLPAATEDTHTALSTSVRKAP